MSEAPDDPADAEFISAPDPPFRSAPPSPRYWLWLLLAGGIAVISLTFFRGAADRAPEADTTPAAVAGWLELGSCTDTASLDGRALSLLPDGQAVRTDDSAQKRDGTWRLDGPKRYVVTFEQETAYLLVPSEQAPVCMLIKGDLGAADLRASWFAGTADEPPDYDYDPH